MRVFAHPLRVDAGGRIATVEQDTDAEAVHTALLIVSTIAGERVLAPMIGIPDPVGTTGGLDESTLRALIHLAEPEIELASAQISSDGAGRQQIDMAVTWADDDEETE